MNEELKVHETAYFIYDHRYLSPESRDRATVLCAAFSLKEAKKDRKDLFNGDEPIVKVKILNGEIIKEDLLTT